jgi:hypothetical protein
MDRYNLEELIEEITVDAYGEDEQLWAFLQAFEDNLTVPCDGFVIGEPVSVIAFDYDGNERRGITAQCRRPEGTQHVVAACDVVLPRQSNGALYIGAYRKWLGLAPFVVKMAGCAHRSRQHRATSADLDLRAPIELVALSVKERAAVCRLLASDVIITLRANHLWDLVPGEIIVVKGRKQWKYAGHPYLSGEVESRRLDVSALALPPLRLEDQGMWDPQDHYWGDEGEPVDEWSKSIIARGSRRAFEMEQALPGTDPDDPFVDPIGESNDFRDAGDDKGAQKILMELCQADLRCLDAHAHLGNFAFEASPNVAIRHYTVGVCIGELSLGDDFDGLLPWGDIDNRPFLRCMHGFALCLWRLGRFEEAERVCNRMLWLNPSDNQGVRFVMDDLRARRSWEDCQEDR